MAEMKFAAQLAAYEGTPSEGPLNQHRVLAKCD